EGRWCERLSPLRRRATEALTDGDSSAREACGHDDGAGAELHGSRPREPRADGRHDRAEVERRGDPPCRLLDGGVERPREVAARAEDERLHRRLRQAELVGDLRIAQALPLAQEDRAPEVLRHARERVVEPGELDTGLLHVRRGDPLLEQLQVLRRLDARAAGGARVLRQADVVGDLVQPRSLELRYDALAERGVDAQEDVLDGVLRVLSRTQLGLAIALDLRAVLLVERSGLGLR